MTNPTTADGDFRKPGWNDPIDTGLDYLRANCRFVMLCALAHAKTASKAYCVIPGWQTSVDISSGGNYAAPDKWVLTRGTMRIEARFVWDSSDNLYSVQVCYDNGVEGGLVCFPPVAVATAATDILWNTDAITVDDIEPNASSFPEIEFANYNSSLGFAYAIHQAYANPNGAAVVVREPTIGRSFSTGEFLFKYEQVTIDEGSPTVLIDFVAGVEGQWYDLKNNFIDIEDTSASSPNEGVGVTLDVTIAVDSGDGTPVLGTGRTKRCKFAAYKGVNEYLINDTFTDTNGTALASHSPDVGGTWVIHSGSFTIQSNNAESGGDARAVIDAGVSDCAVKADVLFDSDDAGLIGRAVNSTDYWELRVNGAGTSDPVLQLIEHNSANSPTAIVRASKTMTGVGPIDTTSDRTMRLMFNGNDIVGECVPESVGLLYRIEHTSSVFNSATLMGIHSTTSDNEWDQFTVTDIEVGRVI